MGAYTLERIGQDFKVSARGEVHTTITQIELVAVDILNELPDYESRDFAISYLLQAANFIALSQIQKRILGRRFNDKEISRG